MNAASFVHAEAQLVADLGLPVKRVRAIRANELTRGTDWMHTGGQVRYSDVGKDRLASLLQISSETVPAPEDLAPKKIAESAVSPSHAPDPAPPAAAPEPTEPPAAAAPDTPRPGDERELVCVKLCMNKAIVIALFGAQRVRVRVKDSAKITPRLKMKCRLIGADLWQLAQPLPRWRGKW